MPRLGVNTLRWLLLSANLGAFIDGAGRFIAQFGVPESTADNRTSSFLAAAAVMRGRKNAG